MLIFLSAWLSQCFLVVTLMSQPNAIRRVPLPSWPHIQKQIQRERQSSLSPQLCHCCFLTSAASHCCWHPCCQLHSSWERGRGGWKQEGRYRDGDRLKVEHTNQQEREMEYPIPDEGDTAHGASPVGLVSPSPSKQTGWAKPPKGAHPSWRQVKPVAHRTRSWHTKGLDRGRRCNMIPCNWPPVITIYHTLNGDLNSHIRRTGHPHTWHIYNTLSHTNSKYTIHRSVKQHHKQE